jgi:hypothetical protein
MVPDAAGVAEQLHAEVEQMPVQYRISRHPSKSWDPSILRRNGCQLLLLK